MKACTGCGDELEEWRAGHYCKRCAARMQRERRARDPEKARAYDRERRKKETSEQRAARNRRHRERYAVERAARVSGRPCVVCGDEIPVKYNATRMTCSDECHRLRMHQWALEHQRKRTGAAPRESDLASQRIAAAKREQWRRGIAYKPRPCSTCEREFVPNSGGHRYCGEQCATLGKRAAQYGVPVAVLWGFAERQNGKCAICEKPWAHVDHCHESGRIRGLLCQSCNTSLGGLGDNAQGLRRALEYLEAA